VDSVRVRRSRGCPRLGVGGKINAVSMFLVLSEAEP
jgi:hypothetical protein